MKQQLDMFFDNKTWGVVLTCQGFFGEHRVDL